jgi:ubiquinone/menaquinone biosynthesis C-methylase UbiE
MILYKGFADLYTMGPYQFSERMAKLLPSILKKFHTQPKTLLDIACGDGRFAVIMAKRGLRVTGVDGSNYMLKYAKLRAKKAGVKIKFMHQKMQNLSIDMKFDVVTCWFDSMNYLLTKKELYNTFRNVYNILNENGLFIFDMNTIFGLSINWQDASPSVIQDSDRVFEVHICPPGFTKNIAVLKIVGYIKKGRRWQRFVEVHKERGYTLKEIRKAYKQAHLKELACWGNIKTRTKPKRYSGKVWFVTRRKKRLY